MESNLQNYYQYKNCCLQGNMKMLLMILSVLLSQAMAFTFDQTTFSIDLKDPKQPITQLSISNDGEILAAISLDSRIYVYHKDENNANSYRISQEFLDSSKPLTSIDITSDNQYIIAGGWETCILIYQKNHDKHYLRNKLCREGSNILKTKFLQKQQGVEVLVARMGGEIQVFKLENGNLHKVSSFNAGERLMAVDTTQDGNYLVTAGNQMPVSLYKYTNNKYQLIKSFTDDKITVRSVSIVEDGNTVAFTNEQRCIFVYSNQNDEYRQLQKQCPQASSPDKCLLTNDATYLLGYSNIGKSIYVYKRNGNKYELLRQIQKETFLQGVNYLTINDELSHLAVALANSADGSIDDDDIKITVMTQKIDDSNLQVVDYLVIVAVSLGAFLIAIFVLFFLYRKIKLDKAKQTQANQTLGSTSTITSMDGELSAQDQIREKEHVIQ